jgi:methionyl-tRNA synthetase
LNKWILEGHKNDWKPNVYGQVKSWIDGGLKPRAVTRDLIGELMFLLKVQKEKLYVWFDAPIGYISSTKEWAAREGKDWEPIGKMKTLNWFTLLGKTISFFTVLFSQRC